MTTETTSSYVGEPRYAWDVHLVDQADRSEAGVSRSQAEAVAHVQKALRRAAAGAFGKVRKVAVNGAGNGPYVDLEVIGEAEQTGTGVAWRGAGR
ncbi:hypothetical protein ACGFNU_24325 [Spirillospora sp. NPDC048911]|uniref:hypothetical protein n=1 Tax=Spirillospora sp. NPDC048911 TaxID=3364527 RepID=UPI00371EF2DF